MTEHAAELARDIEAVIGSPNASSTRWSSSCGKPPCVLDTIGQTFAAENGGPAIGIMLACRPAESTIDADRARGVPVGNRRAEALAVETEFVAMSCKLGRVTSTCSSNCCKVTG